MEVERLGLGVEHHVLDHRAEARGGGVDLGLRLRRERDRLGVAAALEVEGAAVGPAVLVVADQHAVGRGRERRLARAREPEEHGRVHRVAGRVVGRAVHRHHAALRQEVVQEREHRLLVLARVLGAGDQDRARLQIHGDHGLRAAAVARGVCLEGRAVEDRAVGREGVELGPVGPAQEVADEQRVPGQLGDHAHVEPVGGVGAGVKVLHEGLAALQMRDHVGAESGEGLRLHRGVVGPPDMALGAGRADDELVLGRAAGMRAGLDQHGAAAAERALPPAERMGHEVGLHEVVVDGAEPPHPLVLETQGGVDAAVGARLGGHLTLLMVPRPIRRPSCPRPRPRHNRPPAG